MKGIAIAVLGLAALAVWPAGAQRPGGGRDALDWLAGEPVTLLDWGMVRLREDLDRAVDAVARETRSTVERTGVFYRPPDRRILLYVTFVELPANRSGDVCRDLYGRIAGTLVHGAPQGSGGASWYLESVFAHEGRRGDRPADLGEQMVDRVILQVTVGPGAAQAFADGRRVVCSGRLDSTGEGILLRVEG
ncbi:hypothetical protein [Azospirillum thermophilum]|uniref:Uncharacterized protein n=1 Tax=Azospirillum thermophilum TaxID=2202148 RepID=A0A2S2CJY6_9PROT|nr:hypothetical protein [Azospirillum thermophilum]AWK84804.1 hypothetical protein DEW08_00105 [Azospirillum thermophilum]